MTFTKSRVISGATTLAAVIVLSLAGGTHEVRAQSQRNLTKSDIDRWMTELSNWERWGEEDQLGALVCQVVEGKGRSDDRKRRSQ